MKNANKKGFTLVELLVVIAIIAIIAAVAVPVTIGQINKAKISTAAQEAGEVKGIVVQAVQDLAIKGKLTCTDLASALNESYTSLEQCTYVVVTKKFVKDTSDIVTITVITSTDAAKAEAENKIATSATEYKVGVTTTLPGESIDLYTCTGTTYTKAIDKSSTADKAICVKWDSDNNKFVTEVTTNPLHQGSALLAANA